jgi:hypothetical protein
MNRKQAVAIALASAFVTLPSFAQHTGHAAVEASQNSAKAVQTTAALRDLWLGHIFWVRNVAAETIAGNNQAAAAAEKEVVSNARQIAAAIQPFYGKAASEKLFGLLARHYGAVKQYLEASVSGNKTNEGAAYRDLTANAADIARFLSGANPNLHFETVNGLLVAHGAHHIQQIQQFRSRQYAEEAKTWEEMKKHMYAISDALAAAIAKQFPVKFS